MLPVMLLASCSVEGVSPVEAQPEGTLEKEVAATHDKAAVGTMRSNPYSVTNMRKAYAALYSTRTEFEESELEDIIPVTDLYVRFLPKDMEDFSILEARGVTLIDSPLVSYEAEEESCEEAEEESAGGLITWQYAVVPNGFVFPDDIEYQILDECFIPEDGGSAEEEDSCADDGELGYFDTRSISSVDWTALERRAFECSGNGELLEPETRAKVKPSGKITISDTGMKNKNVGVAGVKVIANVFVKVSTTFTDASGNYAFSAKFSAKPTYRLCFKNQKGFSIGLNTILVPASLSSLGKGSADGISINVASGSDATLFRRCAVNNAAYDFYEKCQTAGITLPPRNLRFWIIGKLTPSSALMMHHGAFLDEGMVANYLGLYKVAVQIFCPDITIGAKGSNFDYASLYSDVIHEMAHATHFVKVGTEYWNKFSTYIITTYLTTGDCYGTGNGENAGYCEVAEMWAYYIENAFYASRYGSNPRRGENFWFKPQILSTLEAGGITKSEICEALKTTTTDIDALKDELLLISPSNKTLINNTFKRYSK